MAVTAAVSLKSLGTSGSETSSTQSDDLRGELRVLAHDVALGAVAALRTGEAVLDAHDAARFQLQGVGLPAGPVVGIVAGDGPAGARHGEAVRVLLHEAADLVADPAHADGRSRCRSSRTCPW